MLWIILAAVVGLAVGLYLGHRIGYSRCIDDQIAYFSLHVPGWNEGIKNEDCH
jgi:hypothetical protein